MSGSERNDLPVSIPDSLYFQKPRYVPGIYDKGTIDPFSNLYIVRLQKNNTMINMGLTGFTRLVIPAYEPKTIT